MDDKKKTPMPEQDPKERVNNFQEVPLGYGEEEARREAERCLQCKHKPCVNGCPVSVSIPQFISAIQEGEFLQAADIIKETNSLPAICGRVCPQEDQCEEVCVRANAGEPVAIGRLERFAADYALKHGEEEDNRTEPGEAEKKTDINGAVAVVGAGPAGLTAASDLVQAGFEVTIFEALHDSGGVLRYGIPQFRLPKEIVDREVSSIQEMGAHIRYNTVVGKTVTIDELLEGEYDAVFIGSGAGLPWFLNIPGENLNGIYSANEFLTRVNLMKAYRYPEYKTPVKVGNKVAVIGAGNVAMDAARTALRLDADEVSIVYRRSEAEMPARQEEIEHAKEEGVEFRILNNPVCYHGQDGRVDKMECVRMELGEEDDSGRPRPMKIEGSNWKLDVDTVIVAIGQSPNPLITDNTPGLEADSRGRIKVNEDYETTKDGVFAGGDAVTGAATVIEAMGAGRRAATAIKEYLQ
ncbi:MAG: NADPH-dependent glutamate synthase [Halanaerobiaceae bacterium]